MNSLSFENRISLTRKSEDLTKIVEELSSSYAKREDFVLINPRLFANKTSEIIFPTPVWYLSYVLVYLYNFTSDATVEGGSNYAIVDSTINKNVV